MSKARPKTPRPIAIVMTPEQIVLAVERRTAAAHELGMVKFVLELVYVSLTKDQIDQLNKLLRTLATEPHPLIWNVYLMEAFKYRQRTRGRFMVVLHGFDR